MNDSVVLEAHNLYKEFKSPDGRATVAINDVSLMLARGECLAVVGESGCGKSTLVRIISRLMDPDSGSIVLDGVDITHLKGKALRTARMPLQMVFQLPTSSFDPRRTLGQSIAESLVNRGISKKEALQRASEALEACGLSAEFAERYPHQVSGGQCQRAAVARALVCDPAVLVCDEATSALDVTVQKQIITLLAHLREERGLSLLFICHDLALAQGFADRILVMDAGQIVEEGTPDQIIGTPQTPAAQRLVNAAL